jgi:hypothetical protein
MIVLDGPSMDQVEEEETSDNEMDVLDESFEQQEEENCSYKQNLTRKRKAVSVQSSFLH